MRQLLIILSMLALVIILVGGVSAFILRETVESKDEVISQHAEDLLLLEDFIATNERAARKARSFLLTGNPRFLNERQQAREEMAQQLAELKRREKAPEGLLLLERIETLEARLKQEVDGLLQRRTQGMDAEQAGRALELEVQPDRDEVDAVLARFKRLKTQMLEQAKESSGQAVSRAFVLLALAIGACMILAGVLATLLLRSWKQLLDAAQFQQRVIAIVGHDVRSPLAAILASASHALRRRDVDSRLEGLLSRVLRSARRIEVLTKLLMDFSQTRLTPRLNLEYEPGDLHQLCERVVAEARQTWGDRTVVLEKTGDGSGDFDRDRLRQVVANLVDNALRHGAANSPVRVASRGTNPSVLELSIHNEGPPIEPKLLPHIFEPFQHGKRPQEVVRESMGMGLYIVSEVVKAHGGRIEVESTQERGTTFTVRLPRVPVPLDKLPTR
jgi:signal transduction histidine kinase